jgi:pilus assembly protein Flp/PilA
MLRFLTSLHCKLWATLARDEGQGLAEYALILVLVSVVAIASLSFMGGKVTDVLSTAGRAV